jgi:exonuclease SbcC
LSLDHITDKGEQAAEVAKLLTARQAGIRQEQAGYQAKRDTRDKMHAERQESERLNTISTDALPAAKAAVEQAAGALQETTRLSQEAQEATEKRAAITKDIQEIGAAMEARSKEIAADIHQENVRLTDVTNRYDDNKQTMSSQITALEANIKTQGEMLARRPEIEQAEQQVTTLQAALEQAEQAGKAASARVEQLRAIQEQATQATNKATQASTLATTTQYRLDKLVEAAALIDDVPCRGSEMQERCKLLASAAHAKESIPVVEHERSGAIVQLEADERDRDRLLAESEPLSGAVSDLNTERDRYAGLNSDLTAARATASHRPVLDNAQGQLDRDTQERDRIQAGMLENVDEINKILQDIDKRIQELLAREQTVRAGGEQEQAACQARLDAIPEPGSLDALQKAQEAHQAAEQALEVIERGILRTREQTTALEARIGVLDTELAGAAALEAQEIHITNEIGLWRQLAGALGRDGIIALCIDDAGPTLASLTNDLLLSCYGPRFTVAIQTQAETAKGDTRETFDIRVFDGEQDTEKSVSDMSGGEKIYINEALTAAIALYQSQQADQTYGCRFSDESDGALDPERKVMFTSMKRKVLEIGGYQREIFITHTPALWDLADATIDLNAMHAE